MILINRLSKVILNINLCVRQLNNTLVRKESHLLFGNCNVWVVTTRLFMVAPKSKFNIIKKNYQGKVVLAYFMYYFHSFKAWAHHRQLVVAMVASS